MEMTAMIRMTTSQARQDFKKALQKAARGERILLSSHGKPVAAVVPIEDLELLQTIEDRVDARAAKKALAAVKRKGTVPWEQVKSDLDL
jgi:prevent-host-death family protein